MQTVVDGYTCIFMDDDTYKYIQISAMDGDVRTSVKCATAYDDPTDSTLTITDYAENFIAATTKHFRLIIGFYAEEPAESNGRYELYFRESEEDSFINWVATRMGLKQSTTEHLMRFIRDPSSQEVLPPRNGNNNNNNRNEENNAPNNPAGGRRRKNRKTRKGRK
jgi:hypothetical protein